MRRGADRKRRIGHLEERKQWKVSHVSSIISRQPSQIPLAPSTTSSARQLSRPNLADAARLDFRERESPSDKSQSRCTEYGGKSWLFGWPKARATG